MNYNPCYEDRALLVPEKGSAINPKKTEPSALRRLFEGIVAARIKRMALKDPGQSEVSSFYYAVFTNSKAGIGGARRRKATRGRQKRRYCYLIESDKAYYGGPGITEKGPHF